jgi:hypothetical protein
MRDQSIEVKQRLADCYLTALSGSFLTGAAVREARRRTEDLLDPPNRPRGKHERQPVDLSQTPEFAVEEARRG